MAKSKATNEKDILLKGYEADLKGAMRGYKILQSQLDAQKVLVNFLTGRIQQLANQIEEAKKAKKVKKEKE